MKYLNKYLFLFCLLFIYHQSQGQVGLNVSQFIPNGDLGAYYNSGISTHGFIVKNKLDGEVRVRFGLLYAKLSPKVDTLSQYEVDGSGSSTLIYPGYVVNHSLTIYEILTDLSYRVIHKNNLSYYAGFGYGGGLAKESYFKAIETRPDDNGEQGYLIFGLGVNTSLEYKLNEKLDVFCEGKYMYNLRLEGSYNYTYYTIGVGINFFINRDNDNIKEEND